MLLVPGVEHSLFPHQHHVTRRTWDYFVHTYTAPGAAGWPSPRSRWAPR